jgi:phosphate transport system protein
LRGVTPNVSTSYQDQLSATMGQLGEACGMAGHAIQRATQALLQADLELAESVILSQTDIAATSSRAEEKAFVLLGLQAPGAGNLRAIVSAIQIVGDVERMGALASHVAKIARQRHPQHAVPEQLNGYVADMGALAAALASGAGDVLLSRDPRRAAQIRHDGDVMDELHRQLLSVLIDRGCTHRVAAGIDIVLLGGFYGRFADHAVQIARRVIFQATSRYEYPPVSRPGCDSG